MRPSASSSSSWLSSWSLVAFAAVLPAQGVVNPTLLQADPGEASSPTRRAGLAGTVADVRGGVVWVAIEVDGERGKFPLERAGSGVVVDASGLVLTWGKLVRAVQGASDKRLFVQLDDAENTQLAAGIVRIDDASGFALLRVTPPAAGLRPALLGPDRPEVGEPLVVVARPAGKEMLAFSGAASSALAAVTLAGVPVPPAALFLTDSRNDERCDGAPVFDSQGRLVGLYDSAHVQRDKSEPTLEELKLPSFGVAVAIGGARKAFAAEFAAASNASLRAAGAASGHAHAAAVRTIAPSVVAVWAGDGDWPTPGGKDPGGVVRRDGVGSGVVVSARGLVIANAHVVKAGEPRVRLADGTICAAKVVKTNLATNLAMLQLELPAGVNLTAAACNADDDIAVGEVVLAVGNPYGLGVVAAAGVVSAKRDREGGRIQADASLGAQNGGGAVVDVTGRLLGIGDAGAMDPVEMAFAMRGDRVSTETNLSTFVGIARVRKVFAEALADAGADESIRAPVPANEQQKAARASALTAMVQKASGAMLNVYIARNVAVQKDDDPFAPEPKWVGLGMGSGVIIDRSGLAISNWHVVDEATRPDGSMVADHRVTVRTFAGKEYPVKVLSISREDDLSLLQLELAAGEEVQAVELGSSEALAIGEWVAAIGNPHGKANTVTFGVLTAKGQELGVRGRFAKLKNLLETDAAINGGNSGGALLDMNGRLVGINSAGGGTFNNKGYAIEVDHVRKQVLGLLFAAYKLRSPDLGMRVVDEDGAVRVFDTDPRGPAAKAGVQAGDRVLALGDVAITWSPSFAMTLARVPAGAPVALKIARGAAEQVVQVTPFAPEVWAVVRQSGLLMRDFPFGENPEAVRAAAIAMHRQFTGDRTGEPSVIPSQMVVVDKVFAGEQPDGTDIAVGDFLLAAEFVKADTADAVLVRIGSVAALRDLWNDRRLGAYERDKARWNCWLARDGKVRQVELLANRLFW